MRTVTPRKTMTTTATDDVAWTWSEAKKDFIEVVPVGASFGRTVFQPVDRRNGDEKFYSGSTVFYKAKPEAKEPPAKVGVRLEVEYDHKYEVVSVKRSSRSNPHFRDMAQEVDWEDIAHSGLSTIKQTFTIVSVTGYEADKTHICGWCEEYSAAQPAVDALCQGCKRSDWREWVRDADVKFEPGFSYSDTIRG